MRQITQHRCLLHVLVCTNQRDPGGLPSCGPSRGKELLEHLRRWTIQHNLRAQIWLTETACLGWCHAKGTTIAIYPHGHFYQAVNPEDCEQLIETYFTPLLG